MASSSGRRPTSEPNVYVHDLGEFVIPVSVLSEARALNAGKSLFDRRTRGSKRLDAWAESHSKMKTDGP